MGGKRSGFPKCRHGLTRDVSNSVQGEVDTTEEVCLTTTGGIRSQRR